MRTRLTRFMLSSRTTRRSSSSSSSWVLSFLVRRRSIESRESDRGAARPPVGHGLPLFFFVSYFSPDTFPRLCESDTPRAVARERVVTAQQRQSYYSPFRYGREKEHQPRGYWSISKSSVDQPADIGRRSLAIGRTRAAAATRACPSWKRSTSSHIVETERRRASLFRLKHQTW